MNYEVGNKKWNESVNYRLLISAMSKVRWLVSHGRHKRPDGAQDVKLLMERLGKFANEEFGVDYVTQLDSVSEFVGLSVQELRYLADVGEWIEIERKTNARVKELFSTVPPSKLQVIKLPAAFLFCCSAVCVWC